jgi:nucleotide-binding universal stress UspA family protein
MKKILLPTDFSDNAYNAIKYAIDLFENDDCIFYLLNTYTPVLYDTEYILYSPSPLSLNEIYRNKSLKGLEKVKRKIKKDFPNSKHEWELVSSFNMLSDEIKEQVEEKKIDLVVMGTQGATGAKMILFGTHTVHAIKKTNCPLLAIPSGFKFKSLENILFPTDYNLNFTTEHLKFLREISKNHASTIHVVNVYFGIPPEANQLKSKKLLEDYFKNIPQNFYSIEKSSVSEGIQDFQKKIPVDLLAMISNKHSFFENLLFRPVINEIGFQVKIPFLVIPSGKFNT